MKLSNFCSPAWSLGWIPAIVISAFLANPSRLQAADVTRVEEDWELVIGTPSPNSDAPQVTCLISPVENAGSVYATFIVNHHDEPSFVAGGLQLQAWNGKEILASKRHADQAVLVTPGETIRWTQAMSVENGNLVFETLKGVSNTWGNFGAEGAIKVGVPTQLLNLNKYDPKVSIANSSVSFAANRVQSLVLKRVRTYSAAGLIAEDVNPRVVHPKSL